MSDICQICLKNIEKDNILALKCDDKACISCLRNFYEMQINNGVTELEDLECFNVNCQKQDICPKYTEEIIEQLLKSNDNPFVETYVTCQICLEKIISDAIITLNCNHRACSDCLTSHLDMQINNGTIKLVDFECYDTDCQTSNQIYPKYTLEIIEMLLGKEIAKIII